MSIDIYISTQDSGYHVTGLNLSNTNAADLLEWIGLDIGLWDGVKVRASTIAPLCRRRLWDVKRNYDPELLGEQLGRVTFCGRRPGYLREKTQELLKVCELAMELHPEADIYWG